MHDSGRVPLRCPQWGALAPALGDGTIRGVALRHTSPRDPPGGARDLQDGPVGDDDVGDDEENEGVVEGALVEADPWDLVHPGVARGDAEHGEEGAVEAAEGDGRDVGEEGHAHDGVCEGREGGREERVGGKM